MPAIPPARPNVAPALAAFAAACALLLWPLSPAAAQASPESWELLPERFESTGGGGWMIEGYRPVVLGSTCVTDFVAVSPDGKERFQNMVVFEARPASGGVMCTQGRWRAKDGSAEGTTPLEVFIKDGVVRRAP